MFFKLNIGNRTPADGWKNFDIDPETERSKLLQIVMFGQSELDNLLRQPNLRQINQRIGFSFNTGPLSVAEAVHYMGHRVQMSRVDGIEFPIFSDGAMEAISKAASFVPRVINILADKLLLVAYGDGAIQVTENHAKLAIVDSPQLVSKGKPRRRISQRMLYGIIAAEVAAVIALFALSPPLQGWANSTFVAARNAFGVIAPAVSGTDPAAGANHPAKPQ